MSITNISSESIGAAGQSSYQRIERGMPLEIQGLDKNSQSQPAGDANFMDMLKGFVGEVNDIQLQSGKMVDAFAAGEVTDVHQVMVASQEAGLALDLLLEVRNRTMEAFQEIMRMQV
jgi:flagellar hook-basal body complex protein FliE